MSALSSTVNEMACQHENFSTEARIGRITDGDGGPVVRYTADIKIQCSDCALPFQFFGLPVGVDLEGDACVSLDGTEARLCLGPQGEQLPLRKPGSVRGFRVRVHGRETGQ